VQRALVVAYRPPTTL